MKIEDWGSGVEVVVVSVGSKEPRSQGWLLAIFSNTSRVLRWSEGPADLQNTER